MRLAKLNEHTIDVLLDEQIQNTTELTNHPVEKGVDITDHAKSNPTTISISGAFIAPLAWERLKPLRDMEKNHILIRYVGRNIYRDMMITDLSTSHPAGNSEGAEFSMTLQQVHFARGRRFNNNVKGTKTKTQVAKRTQQGRKQVKVR